MKNRLLKKSILILFSGLVLFSCRDRDEKEIDRDPNTTLDNANSQSVFDDALKTTEDVLSANSAAKISADGSTSGSCAQTVTYTDLGNDHKIFTIIFNGNVCLKDSKTRSGKLVVDLKGATYNSDGAVLTVKSVGYTVNGILVNGKKTVTCVSPGIHNIVVSDTTTGSDYATIKYLNGSVASWKTIRTRKLVAGGSDLNIGNNVYDISATPNKGNPVAEGINREGRHYVVNINSPIRIDFNCFNNNTARYPTQGILELVPDGKSARSIDYGLGDCDNKVVVTVTDFSFPVTLGY